MGDRRKIINNDNITLDSWANASKPRGRRKCNAKTVIASNSQISAHCDEEDLDWFDRSEDDIAADVEQRLAKRQCGEKSSLSMPDDQSFNVQVFPYDFWFTLSNYIPPEDIGRFALICRMTAHIVSSLAFWRRLYTRYYDPTSFAMSVMLSALSFNPFQPESMTRLRGFRTRVIKLLHQVYPPFIAHQHQSRGWPDLDPLLGRTCMLHWSQQHSKRQCFFYFKLKDCSSATRLFSTHQDHFEEEDDEETDSFGVDRGLLDNLSNINYNTEDGCCLLQVRAVSWCLVEPLLGLTLKNVSLSASAGMRHHKLGMVFGSRYSTNQDVRVVIDTVGSVKVLNWWHPNYHDKPSPSAQLLGLVNP